jgi:hypothetical protein
MPNFDTRRVFDRWARFRSQIERIIKTGGDTSRFVRSELRQNMFGLHCARRKRMYNACGHGVSSWVQPLPSTSEYRLYILFLPAQRAIEIGKSEESSRRKSLSHMHQTLNKHVICCLNIISSAPECVWCVLRVLFDIQFFSLCPQEISAAKNTRSREPGMLTGKEKVLQDHKHILYPYASRFCLYCFTNFGP